MKNTRLLIGVFATVVVALLTSPLTAFGGSEDAGRSPGQGYQYKETGACAGSWQHTDTYACAHLDDYDSSLAEGDELLTLDLEYVAEVASSSTSGYCNNSTNNKFRVLYVTTTTREDRYSSLKGTLRDKAEAADYYVWKSAKQTNASRHFRYVCNSSGEIAIGKEVLGTSADDSFSALVNALRGKGYNDSNRKYLVFADWKVNNTTCGTGHLYDDDELLSTNRNNSGDMFGVVYLRLDGCGWATSAFHEMGHNLGGVVSTAPRHDDYNAGHPRDENDIMAYGTNTYVSSSCTESYHNRRYDCNKNDYFDPSPSSTEWLATHWNTAKNKFLVGGGGL